VKRGKEGEKKAMSASNTEEPKHTSSRLIDP
jgi:hypothetical protein